MTKYGTDTITLALYTNTSLHRVDLSGNTTQNLTLLSSALKKHVMLNHLLSNDNCLGDRGVQEFLAFARRIVH